MKAAHLYLQWFVAGMGSVMGINHVLPPRSNADATEVEAIGRDTQAVGNDFRTVMRRHPATADSARALGETPRQLDLGIS